jgi:hypothetical protein
VTQIDDGITHSQRAFRRVLHMLRLRAEQANAPEGDLEVIDSFLLQAHSQVTESIFRVHTPREQSLDWSGRSVFRCQGTVRIGIEQPRTTVIRIVSRISSAADMPVDNRIPASAAVVDNTSTETTYRANVPLILINDC